MLRRKFIQRITSTLSAVPTVASATRTVTWRIEGFSCITCAVGLDAMLHERNGVVRSESSYEHRTATIEFHPDVVTERRIREFIQELGFKALD